MSKNNKDQVEELPIEEFDGDNQDIREDFLKKFRKQTEDTSKENKDEKR